MQLTMDGATSTTLPEPLRWHSWQTAGWKEWEESKNLLAPGQPLLHGAAQTTTLLFLEGQGDEPMGGFGWAQQHLSSFQGLTSLLITPEPHQVTGVRWGGSCSAAR